MPLPSPPPQVSGIKQDELRRHNLSLLLRYVHLEGPTQRATLTAQIGLNRSTIGALAADLAAAGLIREETPGVRSGAGRPSLVVVPEIERYQALAFDLRVDRIDAARVGLGGILLARETVPLPDGHRGFDEVIGLLRGTARLLTESLPEDTRLVGVGVAIPAVVRDADGFVRFAPNLGWEERPFGDTLALELERALPRRPFERESVLVANDADLGALAEHTRGVARGHEDVVYLSGNVGLGAGVICGGRPLRGHGGYAGEVGHMIVNPTGQRCRCGARGCWETEVGIDAIVRAAGRTPGDGTTVRSLVSDALAGDELARSALYEVSRWLAVGVGNLVNIFNPELVIFGGDLRELLPMVHRDVVSRMGAGGLTVSREHVELVPSALGVDSPLFGAAELAFARLLDDPLGVAMSLPSAAD
ncbi:MAG: ROK family protein [Frankia sp.]|nr:ROK family protein [Frankia sp.]